jgi:hypothetical protein
MTQISLMILQFFESKQSLECCKSLVYPQILILIVFASVSLFYGGIDFQRSLLPIILGIFTCAYIVWAISPPYPHPLPTTPPCFQAEPVLPYLILWKRRHKHNKKDKAFLLVGIRIVHCFHAQVYYNPS